MFRKVLIANRGAIARRIIRTLRRMDVKSVAVFSDVDRHSLHVEDADESVFIGLGPPAQSYLDIQKVIAAAKQSGAEAIHPGYGFLSENSAFAEACEQSGIVFIGPTPDQLRAFGLKHTARELASSNNVPLLPGTGLLQDSQETSRLASEIGFPVMLKSTAGGGGIGMRLCSDPADLANAFAAVQRVSQSAFKDSGVYLEKYIPRARHIEVQIFGDGHGNVIHLGERDCSVQRRNQKLVEETPAPDLDLSTRRELLDTAVRLARSVKYRSAGTVEFVYDAVDCQFYFLEVNTRLQVEHGVTEEVYGVDLVEWMVRLAAGDASFLRDWREARNGHSIQVRLYAEDPSRNFQPSAGTITLASFPQKLRMETWVESGTVVSPFYDPLIAKLISHQETREGALETLRDGLANTTLAGIESNLEFLRQLLDDPAFRSGGISTRYLESFRFQSESVQVLAGGTITTVQDYPGRLGFWPVGVPPSGPMDPLAFRLGNRLLGNSDSAAGLECVLAGPTLRFATNIAIVLAGADMQARIDDRPIPLWERVPVTAGSILTLGNAVGPGARAYILFEGGLNVPDYLGSKSTFTLGRFGGHGGRAIAAGDVLHLFHSQPTIASDSGRFSPPVYSDSWNIGVLYGPHGAPDFFTATDIETFFATDWRVHHNSSRTGVRLIGPKPQWARPDGGEAGLHPSNIHDNAYAIGTVDFTGDMPVILGPDGPSLGGFVCPATIIHAELWKVGQLNPGDSIRFIPLRHDQACEMEEQLESYIAGHRASPPFLPEPARTEPAILANRLGMNGHTAMVFRQSGDKNLLIEFGELVLDLRLRLRVHALMEALDRENEPGIIEITPGIRSLQVHYNSGRLSRETLVDLVKQVEAEMPPLENLAVPSRVVHLPLSWDDPATQLAIERYTKGVRPDAPWCPSNIEFIRRINGLPSIDDVHRIVYSANYLVLGLGDVYLGAPVATPLDTRQRLVTTKYNPARTWTPENAVGIGGAYLCVYGMEGPGGYQFVGRTIQMWNTYKVTRDFPAGHPWLLRFFDQIRFYPVSASELLEMRDAFPHGKFHVTTAEQTFSMREYLDFLGAISSGAREFKMRQQAAFNEERERWRSAGGSTESAADVEEKVVAEIALDEGAFDVKAPTHASIWTLLVEPGQFVNAGDSVVILEAMKMEIAVASPRSGVVTQVLCKAGAQVHSGQPLAILKGQP